MYADRFCSMPQQVTEQKSPVPRWESEAKKATQSKVASFQQQTQVTGLSRVKKALFTQEPQTPVRIPPSSGSSEDQRFNCSQMRQAQPQA